MTQRSGDDDTSLFDDLDAVSTTSMPPVVVSDDSRAAAQEEEADVHPADSRHRRRHHRWMLALTVIICLVAAALIGGIVYYAVSSSRASSSEAKYSSALRTTEQGRSTLQTSLDSSKDAVSTLTKALPTSAEVEDFSQEWSKGQSLLDKPPHYFSATPDNDAQRNAAVSQLAEYDQSLTNVAKRIETQSQTAGLSDAKALFSSNKTSLQASVEQAQLVMKTYEAQKKKYKFSLTQDSASDDNSDSDSAPSSTQVSIDSSLVDAVDTAMDSGAKLLKTTQEGLPVDIANTAMQMSQTSKSLTSAYDALQGASNDAVVKAQKMASQEAQLRSGAKGELPKALVGTWKTTDGTTMTFAASSLQSHHASATRLSDDEVSAISAPSGQQVVAAWSLTSGGVDGGIEDTTVVLYQKKGDASSQYLRVTTASSEWKLTKQK
jgi:hypothetical protein